MNSFFWGESPRMQRVRDDIATVAPTQVPVLIVGPSGVGKESVAQMIHFQSKARGPFLAVNCAAIPENLLESMLFGHERGVFTGAIDKHIGLFERAAHGTLFLDELGCMPEKLQAKLLRALQEMEFSRLGSHHVMKLSARIVAATNHRLEQSIAQGTFREDLYYRLSVYPITLPSLKGRLEDIPDLMHFLFNRLKEKYDQPHAHFTRMLSSQLKHYEWPGNVRELQNALEYGLLKSKGVYMGLEHMPPMIQKNLGQFISFDDTHLEPLPLVSLTRPLVEGMEMPNGGIRALLRNFEREIVIDVLKRHRGIMNRAHKELGIPKPTLIQRSRMLGIDIRKIKYECLMAKN